MIRTPRANTFDSSGVDPIQISFENTEGGPERVENAEALVVMKGLDVVVFSR